MRWLQELHKKLRLRNSSSLEESDITKARWGVTAVGEEDDTGNQGCVMFELRDGEYDPVGLLCTITSPSGACFMLSIQKLGRNSFSWTNGDKKGMAKSYKEALKTLQQIIGSDGWEES